MYEIWKVGDCRRDYSIVNVLSDKCVREGQSPLLWSRADKEPC